MSLIENLFSNYVATFSRGADMMGLVFGIWIMAVIYITRWWWKKTKGVRLLALYPTILIAMSLVGLLVGFLWLFRAAPANTASNSNDAQTAAPDHPETQTVPFIRFGPKSNSSEIIIRKNHVMGTLLDNQGIMKGTTIENNQQMPMRKHINNIKMGRVWSHIFYEVKNEQ